MKLLLQRSRRERMAVVNKLPEQFFMLHVFIYNLEIRMTVLSFPQIMVPHSIVLVAQCHELPVTHIVLYA